MKTRGTRKRIKRKDKSISVLCRHIVPHLEARVVFFADNVKNVCDANGFNTRRAYDILCVLKGLGLVQKLHTPSASYVWIGVRGFEAHVHDLRQFGFTRKHNGVFTLGYITHACLYLLVAGKCKLLLHCVLQALADMCIDCTRSNSHRRRVYDVVNIMSCFPSLIATIYK